MDQTTDDGELLDRYARCGDDAAFRELVRRHLDLVYSSASRRVGDGHLAEDVTQALFMILAQKANGAPSDPAQPLAAGDGPLRGRQRDEARPATPPP
ncbi:MAG TPA: sigma factor [Tepidisphaeraceae bacterium]|nr:sigma factor [Tepidisphaeraceae bacterium]